MSQPASPSPASSPLPVRSQQRKSQGSTGNFNWGAKMLAPLWGGLAYAAFYGFLPYLPVQQEFLVRYCTSHPLEYITMALFFLGMATLILRGLELMREHSLLTRMERMLRHLAEKSSATAQNLERHLSALRSQYEQAPAREQNSLAGRRLAQALEYCRETGSSDQLNEHLRHFADLEHDRAQQQFGFVNTISWAVPILGFLGTVMGITLAIANVTPDQLDQSLPEVTGGLAVAFDTTALSLSLSLVLVFSTFLVRRKQDDLLNRLEQQIDHRLQFLLKSPATAGFLQNHADVSHHLVEASAQVVEEATQLWRNNLQQLETQFVNSLNQEQARFSEILHGGVTASLAAHQQHLEEMRHLEQQQQEQVISQIQQAVTSWEVSLHKASQHFVEQTRELQTHTTQVLNLIDKQQQLNQLQQNLQETLESNQITQTLDQTLNSLTAAIQLLNSRVHLPNRAA